jgi:hypothetical protein
MPRNTLRNRYSKALSGGDVPVDEINDVADAVEGFGSAQRIIGQAAQDAKDYHLSPEEKTELLDAYFWEDSFGALKDAARKIREATNPTGDKPLRSSQEILDEAAKRLPPEPTKDKTQVPQTGTYPTEPADIQVKPSTDVNSTTVIVPEQIITALGDTGQSLLTPGPMTLDTAMSLGQTDLENGLALLGRPGYVTSPAARQILEDNIAKSTLGQILGQAQGVFQTSQQQTSGNVWGTAAPFERDPVHTQAIEDTLNDPDNLEVMRSAVKKVVSTPTEDPLADLVEPFMASLQDEPTVPAKRFAKVSTPKSVPVQVNPFGIPMTVEGTKLGRKIILTDKTTTVEKAKNDFANPTTKDNRTSRDIAPSLGSLFRK